MVPDSSRTEQVRIVNRLTKAQRVAKAKRIAKAKRVAAAKARAKRIAAAKAKRVAAAKAEARRVAAAKARAKRIAAAKAAAAKAAAAKAAAEKAAAEAAAQAKAPRVLDPFVISTYNVLGSSHTKNSTRYAIGPVRMRNVVQQLNKAQVDVVGLQEFQGDQRAAFLNLTNGQWDVRVGAKAGAPNGVAWRTSKFSHVSTDMLYVPYFHGRMTAMPVVRLKSKTTGQEMVFMSVHNPASGIVTGDAKAWRNEATRLERDYFAKLWAGSRVPMFMLGDMNDRANFFCPFTANGQFHAASGGTNTGGNCQPGSFKGIDWIFGSTGTTFSGFTRDVSEHKKTSDHPFYYAKVA